MKQQRKVVAVKIALIVAVPAILWAYSAGPIAHVTGVAETGEGTCNQVGCHVGTPVNGGGGSLAITAAEGTNYTPGQKQTLTIQVNDSAARRYGFQMTARLASDPNQQAGTFTPGATQFVLCAASNPNDQGSGRNGATCPTDKPLEFIEHTQPFTTNTITVDWTPPATASGDVQIWVSANAANGTGDQTGDHIYNGSLTLHPAATGTKPAISDGGVINAAQFGAQAGVAPGTWVEIYGSNFSMTTREWTGGDFNGNTAPTSLDGVKVSIGGKDAFLRFISPGQINAQVPDNIGTGPVPIVVTNSNGTSDPLNVTALAAQPGLLAPFSSGGKQYVGAFQGANATVVGSPGFTAVKPGDIITLYGIGFGPVDPAVAAGQIDSGNNSVTAPLKIRIGGVDAQLSYDGLVSGLVGLYQFNITVPNVSNGDQPVTVDLGGAGTGQSIFITVKQ